jgi:hypothetical protein
MCKSLCSVKICWEENRHPDGIWTPIIQFLDPSLSEFLLFTSMNLIHKGKPIPVTGRGDAYGSETSMFPNFLENRLADDSEFVSLTRRTPFTPRKIRGTHFCYRLSRRQGHSAAGRITSTEKSNDLIGNRTRDLAVCSIVPQPTTLQLSSTFTCRSGSRCII